MKKNEIKTPAGAGRGNQVIRASAMTRATMERRKKAALTSHAETSEKAIERHLCLCVKTAGGLALKYSNAQQTGYPDRLLLFPGGLTAWVEIKSAGKQPTRLQSLKIAELRDLGFPVWVCDSRQKAEDIVSTLRKLLEL